MSATRTSPRLLAALVALVGTAFATLALGTAAQGADQSVQVTLAGLNQNDTAGSGRGDGFSVRAENKTVNELIDLHRVIVVSLPGLRPEQIAIRRLGVELQKQQTADGQVTFDDNTQVGNFRLAPQGHSGDRSTANYNLFFNPAAPPGTAQLTAVIVLNGQIVGQDQDSINVIAAQTTRPTTPPATTPAPTTPVPTSAATGQVSPTGNPLTMPPPVTQAANTLPIGSGSGIPIALYIVGGILVIVGGAILWLLFRGPKTEPALVSGYGGQGRYNPYGAVVDDPVRPPSLGYPTTPGRPVSTSPTTVMPAVPGGWAPPPPSDPWANGDPTREIGPRRAGRPGGAPSGPSEPEKPTGTGPFGPRP